MPNTRLARKKSIPTTVERDFDRKSAPKLTAIQQPAARYCLRYSRYRGVGNSASQLNPHPRIFRTIWGFGLPPSPSA